MGVTMVMINKIAIVLLEVDYFLVAAAAIFRGCPVLATAIAWRSTKDVQKAIPIFRPFCFCDASGMNCTDEDVDDESTDEDGDRRLIPHHLHTTRLT